MGKKIAVTVDDLSKGEFYTTPELAAAMKLSEDAVRGWIYRGNGPDYVKVGSRTLWPIDAVNRWLAA